MPAPQAWPFQANFKDRISERYGYMTSVMQSYRDDEQRAQLRKHPVGGIEYSFFAYKSFDKWGRNSSERAALIATIYSNQPSKWSVPLWHYAVRLSGPVTSGDSTVPLEDTTGYPFRTSTGLGPYAMIFSGPLNFELVELDTVGVNFISLSTPLANSWPASAVAIPVRIGILDGGVSLSHFGPDLVKGRVRFNFDMTEALGLPADTGHYIIMDGQVIPVP